MLKNTVGKFIEIGKFQFSKNSNVITTNVDANISDDYI